MSQNLVQGYINLVGRVHKISSGFMHYKVVYSIAKNFREKDLPDYIIEERILRPKDVVEGDIVGLRCLVGYDNSLRIQNSLKIIQGELR